MELLDITDTYLGTDEVKALTDDLHHSNLQIIKIGAYNDDLWYSEEADLQNLIKCFMSKCEKFRNVWFSDRSKIHLSSVLSLPFPFYSIHDTTDVNLSDIELQQPVLLRILSDDLNNNYLCSRLSLINCGIDDEGAKILANGVRNSCLEVLELNLNFISDDGALALADSIRVLFDDCIEYNTNLHMLNLSCNSIGDKGALALASAAKKFKLLIWNNKVTEEGIHDMLKIKPDIQIDTLEIDSRCIGESIAAIIASQLIEGKDFSSLHTINLAENYIGDGGIKVLSDVLREATNLHSLNLSSNSITDNGAVLLFNILKNCNNLSSLDLSNNSITDESVIVLADAIMNCTNLNSLNFSSNSFSDYGTCSHSEKLH